jgi:hypothetical protein
MSIAITTPCETRALQIIEDLQEGDSDALAARLWPHWRTQRGLMTRASEGTAFRILKSLHKKGLIELSGNKFRAIGGTEPAAFQLRPQ